MKYSCSTNWNDTAVSASVAEIMGGLGGQLPPQFNKTRKFSVEFGNFEGGIETEMKNESPLRRKEFLF